MELHESAEDYLESILSIKERKGAVRSIDVVNDLAVSKPSVSVAMKKLRENGYITVDAEGYISLTQSGKAVATSVYDRHKVLTRLFVALGVDEEIARQDACKVEHDLSKETFAALKGLSEQYTAP